MFCLVALSSALLAAGGIESLAPPPPAAPPRVEADDLGREDLERKRGERDRRDAAAAPKAPGALEQVERNFEADAAKPHPQRLLIELSLLLPGVATSKPKSGYTVDPTTHFNVVARKSAASRTWYGLRIAPFAGTGFYKGKPGSYGLTFFGPMIGLGKIDPDTDKATSGWLVTTGVAALAKQGQTETAPNDARHSDFSPHKGAIIDGSGLWVEGRYLRVLYGALGVDAVFGYQSGRDRQFIYAGVGTSGIY